MSANPDLSWWTEGNNDSVIQYLDHQLREAIKLKKYRAAAVYCSRCKTTAVEVITLKLPDLAATPVHAIRFRRFSRLPIEINVTEDAPPGEYGRAMAKAMRVRDESTPSYRLGDWDWACVLDKSDAGQSMVNVAHNCKDPQGKRFTAECLLSVVKILNREITAIDPWLPEWRDDMT